MKANIKNKKKIVTYDYYDSRQRIKICNNR